MQTIPYMFAALLVGAAISVQPPLNAILARALGSAYGATLISILVALICALLIVAVAGTGKITGQTLSSVPWWVYLAGTVGAIFVASGVIIAPVTGALLFFVCIVAGQLLGSTIADHFGAFGLAVREISAQRVIGLLLVLGGAVLVNRG